MHFSWNCIVRCHLVKFFRICSSVFKAHAVTWLVSLIGDKNGRPWWSPASSLSACLPAAWSPSLRSPEEPTRLVPSPLPRAPGPRSPPPATVTGRRRRDWCPALLGCPRSVAPRRALPRSAILSRCGVGFGILRKRWGSL